MISELNCVAKILQGFKIYFYSKVIVTTIPTNVATNLLLSLFLSFRRSQKQEWNLQQIGWSSNRKYFWFLFIVSCTLLQRYTEFNRLYKRILLHVISTRIIVAWYMVEMLINIKQKDILFKLDLCSEYLIRGLFRTNVYICEKGTLQMYDCVLNTSLSYSHD